MKPLFWTVLLEIRKPKEVTAGGIVLTADTMDADALLTNVGQVIAVGPMAFKTKTSGGHDYSVHADDVTPGTWVLTARKIGVPLKMRDGRILQMVNDYEILAVLDGEQEAAGVKAYV